MTVYSVVGCGACDALWVVEGRPVTTGCPRCGKRHRFDRLRRLAETDDEDAARQARAALLAERSGHGEAFAEVDSFEELERHVSDGAVSDEEYLGAAGVDPEAAEAAGELAGSSGARRPPRWEVVQAALRELDSPTESAVCEFAAERGVPADAASRLLTRLVEAGAVSEDGGRYRLL